MALLLPAPPTVRMLYHHQNNFHQKTWILRMKRLWGHYLSTVKDENNGDTGADVAPPEVRPDNIPVKKVKK
jgi:hypothetical protein